MIYYYHPWRRGGADKQKGTNADGGVCNEALTKISDLEGGGKLFDDAPCEQRVFFCLSVHALEERSLFVFWLLQKRSVLPRRTCGGARGFDIMHSVA
jgi:hypothetical protein